MLGPADNRRRPTTGRRHGGRHGKPHGTTALIIDITPYDMFASDAP